MGLSTRNSGRNREIDSNKKGGLRTKKNDKVLSRQKVGCQKRKLRIEKVTSPGGELRGQSD